ncbi:hypothetical protein NEHOM01_2208 [Nematocida homosporus]|uniref:uncharacterized protein n=1 Tax=Nematocida homosporus TaxID=1912981 RepID=UPI002220676A|nr:uncharacterized protein NEHOM01_2208 [Nematocida homosporus]KAI5187478.1 hypothetical protein NEHOM01_2208 [Nematocida homosporus]
MRLIESAWLSIGLDNEVFAWFGSGLKWICDNFPYLVLLGALGHGLIFYRSGRIKVLPGLDSWFWQIFGCCMLSVLLKYGFGGARPRDSNFEIPSGWHKLQDLPPLNGHHRILIGPLERYAFLQSQPVREVYNLPLSLARLKSRYGPSSGTPSSHSVLAGYLMQQRYRLSKGRPIVIGLGLILGGSRILYQHHYPYQVGLGMIIGYIIGTIDWL